jgi:hypothetical protein
MSALARPAPISRRIRADVPDRWLTLAEDLQIGCVMGGPALELLVVDFLFASGVPVYGLGEVVAYLVEQCRGHAPRLVWRPLRDRDHIHDARWEGGDGHDYYRPIDPACRTYDKPVPLEILERVKALEERFNRPSQRLHFFISDCALPDPFILAAGCDMSRIVFGAWDEPGFALQHSDERNPCR